MNNDNILVSVIIPAYNVDKYIAFCLDTVIAQTHKKLEIIVVDDGSTDQTGIICDKYTKEDDRIKVMHQKNRGQSAARNAALDIMHGEYIFFLDSDDFIEPQAIEILLSDSLKYNSEIVFFDSIDTSVREFIPQEITNNTKTLDASLLLQNITYLHDREAITCFFHSSIFDKLRFPVGLIYEDSYLLYATIEKATKAVFTDAKLYYYYLSPNSTIRSPFTKKNLDIFFAFEEKLKVLKRNNCDDSIKRIYAQYLYRLASTIGQVKYSPRIDNNFKKAKIKELRKKYIELYKINRRNPHFTNRIKIVSILLFLFPVIKKIRSISEG